MKLDIVNISRDEISDYIIPELFFNINYSMFNTISIKLIEEQNEDDSFTYYSRGITGFIRENIIEETTPL